MTAKQRLDTLLVERGLAATREKARAMILAGQVTVDGNRVDKAGTQVDPQADVVCASGPEYASRGAYKLQRALEVFGIEVTGRVALDAGASTGGFTDVLLRHGVARVYAIDVGYGQIDWRLRQDPRVVVMERTNIRYVQALPEPVDVATADLSFISLGLVLPVLKRLSSPSADFLLLIKPQFEAGREQVGKGGVVRDSQVHRAVLEKVVRQAEEVGLQVMGLTASPLLGPAGNVEFLSWFRRGGVEPADAETWIARAIEDAGAVREGAHG